MERRRLRRALRRSRRGPDHEGGRCASWHVVDVDAGVWVSRGPLADARLRGDARGRNGGVRQELATGVERAPSAIRMI